MRRIVLGGFGLKKKITSLSLEVSMSIRCFATEVHHSRNT